MIRDRRDVEHTRRRRADGSLVRCEQLTVAYGSAPARVVALDRVDLAVHAGETVALWGPSGSGKTTLLHALGGLVEPNEGAVLWNGVPLSPLDADARTRERPRDRLRVPGVEAAARVHGVREHRVCRIRVERRKGRRVRCRGSRDGAADARRACARRRTPAVGALRRRGTAGRDRPRARAAPELLLCDEPTGHLDTDTTLGCWS